MPYVLQEKRKKLDKVVDAMVEADIKVDGDLNYILFKFCKYNIKPGYSNYKNYCAELNEAAREIHRVLLGPYEETAKERNGDV